MGGGHGACGGLRVILGGADSVLHDAVLGESLDFGRCRQVLCAGEKPPPAKGSVETQGCRSRCTRAGLSSPEPFWHNVTLQGKKKIKTGSRGCCAFEQRVAWLPVT